MLLLPLLLFPLLLLRHCCCPSQNALHLPISLLLMLHLLSPLLL
jgi:hypothetical protein